MGRLERIVFFGTPSFAVPTLKALAEAGRKPVLVVTQPSRPAGRGRRLQLPPVGELAQELEVPLLQPHRVKKPDFLDTIRSLEPDVAVVVAFGQIFPLSLLKIPLNGCLNLHASLLPAYRGAAPIQAAIAAGDVETGVSTMVMEKGLDSGPVLLQRSLPIGDKETSGELAPRLAQLGADLMVQTLEELEQGSLVPQAQPEEGVSYAGRIQKEEGRIDWNLTASQIFCRLRAFSPWPGIFSELRGETVKVLFAEPMVCLHQETPGSYVGLEDGRMKVVCGGGTVLGIEKLQRPGRKALDAKDFSNGERLETGERFGGLS
ncbi:MAG: methionyl-tRNA formyltransferase [Deltaproteobacteria bacterium]|nr:methionyl-tRNA formyltransferase [Deltaproteobacteria bacterium]